MYNIKCSRLWMRLFNAFSSKQRISAMNHRRIQFVFCTRLINTGAGHVHQYEWGCLMHIHRSNGSLRWIIEASSLYVAPGWLTPELDTSINMESHQWRWHAAQQSSTPDIGYIRFGSLVRLFHWTTCHTHILAPLHCGCVWGFRFHSLCNGMSEQNLTRLNEN